MRSQQLGIFGSVIAPEVDVRILEVSHEDLTGKDMSNHQWSKDTSIQNESRQVRGCAPQRAHFHLDDDRYVQWSLIIDNHSCDGCSTPSFSWQDSMRSKSGHENELGADNPKRCSTANEL
jgi:hypothetical protein